MNTKISERTLPFQGLRVLLMLGIVMLHTYNKPILGSGRELVSFFFIISGFLYRDKLPWKQYMKKKIWGVYPIYWIVLILSEIICLLRGGNNIHWSLVPHILLLQSWYPDIWFSFDYVGVAWFVSSLMFCYVVSPMLYRRISKMSVTSSCIALVLLFVVLFALDLLKVPYEDARFAFREWLCYANPLCCLMQYVIGMLLWNAVKQMPYCRMKVSYEPIALCVVVAYVYAIYAQMGGQIYAIHTVMIFLVYMFGSKIVNLLFANKMMIWLSTFVMFVYMSHQSLTLNCLQSRIESKVALVILCFVSGITYGMFYRKYVAPKIKKLI